MKQIDLVLAAGNRDLRLDLFRGIANWAIFLDHIPNNLIAWITTRNYGFSDAADLFVFISGYTTAFVYARVMHDRGFAVAAIRLLKRAWQLYVAHVLVVVVFIVAIGFAAQRFNLPALLHAYNVAGLNDDPIRTVFEGLLLKYRPVNLDVLPLNVVLMSCFPVVLWSMLRKPDLTLAASIALYLAARTFDWNLPAFPQGYWYFNPLTWQLLFVTGAWLSLGGGSRSPQLTRPWVLCLAVAYLVFALVMTLAASFQTLEAIMPKPLFAAFNPNDKTNLAPYRFIHLIVLAFVVTRFIPSDWKWLKWRGFRPAIVCGQHSLQVFCSGVFLSFMAHFALMLFGETHARGGILLQLFVSLAGIAILCAIAWCSEWADRIDKPARVR